MAPRLHKPRLLFLEQFYYPDGWGGAEIPRDLTMHLARSGYAVEVICGTDQYAPVGESSGTDPATAGVRIRRVPRLLPGPAKRFKLLRQSWFYLCLSVLLLTARRPHLLVAQTNPPLGVWFAALASRLRGTRFMVIAQDLYPEVLVAHGALDSGSALAGWLGRLFGWAYRSADRVVALGPTMRDRILAKGVARERVSIVSNWSTGPQAVVRRPHNDLAKTWHLADSFIVLYSGNLGIGHEFETLLSAVAGVAPDCPDLRLLFIGQGSRLAEVKQRVTELGVDALVSFRPLVPAEQLSESLGLADIAVVTLRPGFEGLIVPSKQLGYMARGIPTLYIGPPSDVSALVEESGGGVTLVSGDVGGVEAALRRAYRDRDSLMAQGVRAFDFYRSRLSRESSLEQYLGIVSGLIGDAGRP